jgi:hypothetical protein
VSSRRMITTLGASAPGWAGVDHHGVESGLGRLMTPSNGSYVFILGPHSELAKGWSEGWQTTAPTGRRLAGEPEGPASGRAGVDGSGHTKSWLQPG